MCARAGTHIHTNEDSALIFFNGSVDLVIFLICLSLIMINYIPPNKIHIYLSIHLFVHAYIPKTPEETRLNMGPLQTTYPQCTRIGPGLFLVYTRIRLLYSSTAPVLGHS